MTGRPVDRLDALFSAYEYELGWCFRCSREGLQVARAGEIVSPEAITPLFACRVCIEELLVMHSVAQARPGRRYVQIPRFPHGAEAT
ncbi:hypothetical protein [Streptomyces sp. NPDC088261]|uniref:hypothetical protein n=1 Tax=Streptomyces sp. NPDC088261 TaxID=3365851 RepID=UPI00382F21E0